MKNSTAVQQLNFIDTVLSKTVLVIGDDGQRGGLTRTDQSNIVTSIDGIRSALTDETAENALREELKSSQKEIAKLTETLEARQDDNVLLAQEVERLRDENARYSELLLETKRDIPEQENETALDTQA